MKKEEREREWDKERGALNVCMHMRKDGEKQSRNREWIHKAK